jgi:hypothetical protein
MLVQVAIVSVILNATKSSLRAYFEGVNWPLNKALPKGAKLLNGLLGDIMRQFLLVTMQVAHQLLNYKKKKYLNTQVSIILNPSNLGKRICKGMAMSPAKFVSSTLMRICNPDTGCGSNFNNFCTVMSLLLPSTCAYVMLVGNSLEDNRFSLLVSVVENWIHDMAERFPKTAAGVPNAQLEFERRKGSNMRVFIHKFMKEYDLSSLSHPDNISIITYGRLGAFLHLALFVAWSDVICDKEKPQIDFLVDCLVEKYALPVIYYVAGWMLFSMLKASTVAADNRPLFFRFAARHTIDECVAKSMNLPTSLVERRRCRALVYCTREYFDFICVIESIFLANLTLKMMLAYNDGGIVAKIKLGILSHNDTRDRSLAYRVATTRTTNNNSWFT